MRRLKNVVIFIQTVLSFVLSRKIINIFQILDQYKVNQVVYEKSYQKF